MENTHPFDFSPLFSASTPQEGRARKGHARPKYDFGVAYPDPDSLPLEELLEATRIALAEEGRSLALYPHPMGYPPLREYVAQKLAADRNIHVQPDDIYLGDGSGQPNHLVAEVLIDPGDVVFTEDFTYGGTLNTLRRFRADIRGVPCDNEGMLPDALEYHIKQALAEGKRPKAIYTIPTLQNPQGWVMTLPRRQEMVRLAQQYDVPIWEDDCYVDLRYEGPWVPSIYSLDDSGRTIYVGSFSKIIGPGMRLGYVTAPAQVLDKIAAVKGGGGVNQFAAMVVHRYATRHLAAHIAEANQKLRLKRDAMLEALQQHFGQVASWSRPSGGLFVWLQMPEGFDTVAHHPMALEADIAYLPGTHKAPDGVSGRNYARLCFGYNTPDDIRAGIARLAEVFEVKALL